MTQRNAVRRVVSALHKRSPRFDVVSHYSTVRLGSTILTGPIITVEHCTSKRAVPGCMEVNAAKWGMPTFPVWMLGTDKMRIARRLTTDSPCAFTDGSAVLVGKSTALQGGCDIVPLRLGDDTAGGSRFSHASGGNLRTGRTGFSRVLVDIAPRGATRNRAELSAEPAVLKAALVARSVIDLWHVVV